MSREITRQLAIMFTDLVGYSSMMSADEHGAIRQLEDYRAILCSIIESHQGTVIEFAGDSIFARFNTAPDAVDAGIEIQWALRQYNRAQRKGLRTRIGVHYGKVLEKDDRIYGDDINIAARLEPLGDPKGVCISEAVYRELDASLQENCVAYGRPLLKNIGDSLEVFQLFPEPVGRRKRLRLQLRRVRKYLRDYPAVSAPVAIAVMSLSIYLLAPVFFKPTAAAHYVELGGISNLSPNEMPEYYTIGIADEINTRLKSIPNLYVSTPEDEIGAEVILSSNIQQVAERVRIAYRITRRDVGVQVGAASMEGRLENMLSLQSDFADRVAADLADYFGLAIEQKEKPKHPIDPEAYQYYLQAREYSRRPDDNQTLAASISLYLEAIRADARFAAAYAGLCVSYWGMYRIEKKLEMVDQAEQACLQAEALNADLAEVQIALGEIYNGRGRMQKSIGAYNRAIQLEPRNLEAFVGLADVYTNANKPKVAEQTYKRALGLQPGSWEAWTKYGSYQVKTGQFDKAEKSFRKVVALIPDSVNAYSNLGAVLLYLGDFKQAVEVFSKAAELKPSADMISNLATMYYYDGDYARSAATYRRAIELAPEQCLYWANLGDALHQLPAQGADALKADEQAMEFCDRELEINSRNREALLVKSKLLARSGQIEEALAAVQIYKSLDFHDVMDTLYLALVFLRSGDMEALKNTLEQAVEQGYPRTLILAEPEFAPVRHESWFRSLAAGGHGIDQG